MRTLQMIYGKGNCDPDCPCKVEEPEDVEESLESTDNKDEQSDDNENAHNRP